VKGTLLIGTLPRVMVPVARNLRAHGIPVHGACGGPSSRRIRSRAFRSFTWLGTDNDPPSYFAALSEVIRKRNIDTVMPCGDDVLLALAPHDEALRQMVRYCGPTPLQCRRILEKRETLSLASTVGVPVPREYEIRDVADLAQMRDLIIFPVVVKPRNKDVETLTGIKSEIIRDYGHLNQQFERFPEFGKWFLIQEFIPGHGAAVEILMNSGNPVVAFQHRRIREYPIRGGVSVAAVSEPLDGELVQHAVAVLRALQWRGAAMVEFRKDNVSGRLGLMEVNGRFWGSVALSLFCSIEFPYYVWQMAHGEQPAPPDSYPAGVRFRWVAGDLKRLYESFTSAEGGRVRAAVKFALDFFTAAKDPTWSWKDPVPALEEFARALASTGLKAGGATARRLVSGPAYRRVKALRHAGIARAVLYLKSRFVSRPGKLAGLGAAVQSVVFICHGNIIRSPMAEAVFRASEPGIRVDSAGTAAVPGRDVDARAAQVAREFGISLDGHKAKRLSAETVASGDLLVVMDYLNYAALIQEFPEAAGKTVLLGAESRGGWEIDDPYEGTLVDIRAVYKRLEESTRVLVNTLAIRDNPEP
jgi:protein-tyrosine-phosphatase/predicted ATP-grasp superfamily ATP-dependent carboligase